MEYIENFDPITDVPNGKYLTGFFSNYPTQKTIDRMLGTHAYGVKQGPGKNNFQIR